MQDFKVKIETFLLCQHCHLQHKYPVDFLPVKFKVQKIYL